MKNRVNKYIWIILLIVLFFLFSYASGQQKQTESMDAEAYNNRGIAYYYKKEYDKSLEDVKKAQNLGYQTSPKFLETLRKASGRPN